jgi:peptidyl-prolyl cis-trans isomerase A (cyclophilin A)
MKHDHPHARHAHARQRTRHLRLPALLCTLLCTLLLGLASPADAARASRADEAAEAAEDARLEAEAAAAAEAAEREAEAEAAAKAAAAEAAAKEAAALLPPPPPPRVYRTARARVVTALGTMVFELETERAPITSANFIRYANEKRFDGTTFYRAMKIQPGYGLVQGGTSNDPKKTLPPIRHEATSRTGLSHVNGALSMARGNPGTASGDFFITIGELVALNADPSKPGDNLGYAVFGRVVEGMDVVEKILLSPISRTKGEGPMRGQMIEAPVKIVSVRILR